jgi:HAD superfamily 5'-nucleotidase-like hydrolase
MNMTALVAAAMSFFLLRPVASFLPSSRHFRRAAPWQHLLHDNNRVITAYTERTRLFSDKKKVGSSSYEVDLTDQDAEQRLNGDATSTEEHLNVQKSTLPSRYAALIRETGLDASEFKYASQLPAKRPVSPYHVFCNRELKLSGIRAIGFDMDYTLAQYQQPAFDQLAFDGAKQKLVDSLGYPEEVLDFVYDHTHWARGLIIDTQRGNFLKTDRHKYVRVAHHGFHRISSTTRKLLYSRTFNKVLSFSEKCFVNMDTLFQFVDAHLYASLIELKDKGEHDILDMKTYEELYRDVRECVDLCHRDGVIKDEVARDPDKYIVVDKGMIPMLKRYKEEGVKVFLLTNSLWEYTSTAMNYLYHGKLVDKTTQSKNEWLDLFDICIVGSCKPAFMLDPYLNLFRVRPEDGSLRNTDGIYEIDALGEDGASKFLAQGKVFQGGNWKHLHALLETGVGEEILYVGDHLYSDVLRSKRTLGWRSAFVMPELEEEMRVYSENLSLSRQVTSLRQLREELGVLSDKIRLDDIDDDKKAAALIGITEEDGLIKQKLSSLAEDWHKAFHPIWGAMFNAGYQDSQFAFYVQNYACLYTSRATNLGLASSKRAFRTGLERLPHDKLLDDDCNELFDVDPWE